MLVYPRAKLLALRKLPHVSERGSEERTGDVVPGGMPQLGEGIGWVRCGSCVEILLILRQVALPLGSLAAAGSRIVRTALRPLWRAQTGTRRYAAVQFLQSRRGGWGRNG